MDRCVITVRVWPQCNGPPSGPETRWAVRRRTGKEPQADPGFLCGWRGRRPPSGKGPHRAEVQRVPETKGDLPALGSDAASHDRGPSRLGVPQREAGRPGLIIKARKLKLGVGEGMVVVDCV